MKYQITHTTRYEYPLPASLCHNEVYQMPLNCDFQKVEQFKYDIQPEPNFLVHRTDFFGNGFIYFSVQRSHQNLNVEVKSEVNVTQPAWMNLKPENSKPWEEVAKWLKTIDAPPEVKQYYLESHHIEFIDGVREYALQSFTPGRPILQAALDLNSRIFQDFKFTPGFTDISTPLEDVFKYRKGVCQDFAHLGLACLRSIGLAARYVSGYIETEPPPGKPKLFGTDASHAWIGLYIPDAGWVEFDATNNLLVDQKHIRVAYGRDFADVVPLKGIVYSGGSQRMYVNVDVRKAPETV